MQQKGIEDMHALHISQIFVNYKLQKTMHTKGTTEDEFKVFYDLQVKQ